MYEDTYVYLDVEFKKESTFQEFIDLHSKLRIYGVNIQYYLIIECITSEPYVICDGIKVMKSNVKKVIDVLKESKNVKNYEVVLV